MSKNIQRFNERVEDIAIRGQEMRDLCVNSQFDAMGQYITDPEARLASIDAAAAKVPMFESLGESHRRQIVSGMASAVAEYEQVHGELPRDEILASAHKSMEGMLLLEGKTEEGSTAGMMMESIDKSLTTSEGVELRAKMIGLVLPTMLYTATSDAVTYIPAQNDEVEIFRIHRIAGSSFGDFKRGDKIDETTVGQYSQMRQRFPFVKAHQPEGTLKEFTFTSKTDLPNTSDDIPMKKGSVSVYFNRARVARDFEQKNGLLYGQIKAGESVINVNGTIDYVTGVVTVTTSEALPKGSELHVEFEVDIEAQPNLIPTIDHEMESIKLQPSQAAIAVDATIQAMFKMQREFGVDLKSMQMSHMRNYLANEKSRKHLRDMDFACRRSTSFNLYVPDGEDWKLHREKMHELFLKISQMLLAATRVSGLRGMYAGIQACTVLKSLGEPFFKPAANYQQTNEVHFAGTLFGVYKVYEAPIVINEWDILCYARGNSHSEAGYVAGDAIPATLYNHPIGTNLRQRNTLWELSYGEIHPFSGADFFLRLTLENIKPVNEAPAQPAG